MNHNQTSTIGNWCLRIPIRRIMISEMNDCSGRHHLWRSTKGGDKGNRGINHWGIVLRVILEANILWTAFMDEKSTTLLHLDKSSFVEHSSLSWLMEIKCIRVINKRKSRWLIVFWDMDQSHRLPLEILIPYEEYWIYYSNEVERKELGKKDFVIKTPSFTLQWFHNLVSFASLHLMNSKFIFDLGTKCFNISEAELSSPRRMVPEWRFPVYKSSGVPSIRSNVTTFEAKSMQFPSALVTTRFRKRSI